VEQEMVEAAAPWYHWVSILVCLFWINCMDLIYIPNCHQFYVYPSSDLCSDVV
jgi:hypothetical protein